MRDIGRSVRRRSDETVARTKNDARRLSDSPCHACTYSSSGARPVDMGAKVR
jgi:hypothetical protein